jgi:hypothetical protein
VMILKQWVAPIGYLVFAWLWLRWPWFQAPKVERDERIPSWMNLGAFWWGVCGVSAFSIFFKIIQILCWYFRSPKP